MATRQLGFGRSATNETSTVFRWIIRALRVIEQVSSTWLQIEDGVIDLGTGVVFTALPGTPTKGMIAVVTDSNTAVWGANIGGSGANSVLAWYNGTNWTVAGK